MDLNQWHFAHPFWLWTLLIIPLIWGLFFLYYRGQQPQHQLEKFIDKHLIPYLLRGNELKKKSLWLYLVIWSFVWSCLVLAMAGPRWDFHEVETFTRDQNLAILLDLSESMNAKDISPSRLGRAKQKIEDLLNMSTGVKVGLIAFAADPHMIAPMTEDKETIRHLLSSLDTDLVYVQGSKLAPPLEMAFRMLKNEPGDNKAIVVISDGGFEDASAIHTAKSLAEKGIVLYAIGVGSLEGAPLKDRQGVMVKKNGSPILTKLEKEKFREISKIGNGRYFDADHSGQVALIFEDLKNRSNVQQEAHKTQRFWEEYFYLFLLPVLPFFLWWYRRGYIFVTLLFALLPSYSQADLSDYFYNTEQQGNQAYESGDYSTAANTFHDPYRKGVAYYRVGDYKAAEEMFRQSTRPEVASGAAYNLGNALAQQNKLDDAIEAYEAVLEKWPDHQQAKENLELIKKMLEQQKQNQEQPQQQEQQQQQQEQQQQENSQNSEDDSNQQKDEQNQRQQEQDKDASKNQDKEQSEESSQNDSSSPEKNEGDKAQTQESADSEESSQESSKNPEQANEGKLTTQAEKEKKVPSQEDIDADLWLNQIKNDPKKFLKNKFYLESKKNGTKEEVDPW